MVAEMHYYQTVFQYRGNNYAGFQWQKNLPTVQDEINSAISSFHKGKVSTVAASRTDSGVHALYQIVKITCELGLDIDKFLVQINSVLPPDIKCTQISACAAIFRPSANVIKKEYRYLFTNSRIPNHNSQNFIANISNELDFELIKKCIEAIIGQHNFCNFCSTGSNVRSTTRKIFQCELSVIDPLEFLGDYSFFNPSDEIRQCYQIRFVANGFLKQMIRHLVSSFWMVGSGKLSYEEFLDFLNSEKKTGALWKVAPANGLYLFNIEY